MRIHLSFTLNTPKSIKYNIKIPQKLQKYFLKSYFEVAYNCEIREADPALMVIPGIGILLPMALATGADIVVETIDISLQKSIEILRSIIKDMYHDLPASTRIFCRKAKQLYINGDNKAVFFSGGVDSTSMLLRHAGERPYTATVWGFDFPLENIQKWNITKAYIKDVCQKLGCKGSIFIALDNPLNIGVLEDDFMGKIKGNDWWGGLQAGITLPLLIAPVAKSKRIGYIYVASDVPTYFKFPWSSRSEIYNVLSFADVKVICDDSEMSRMDKIRIIREKSFQGLKLRVCLNPLLDRLNCSVCEKCTRTAAELTVTGLNPNEFGFDIDISTYSKHIKRILKYPLSPIKTYFWSEIIKEAKKQRHMFTFYMKDIVETLSIIPLNNLVPYEHYISLPLRIRRKIMRIYYSLPVFLREKIDPRCRKKSALEPFSINENQDIDTSQTIN